MPGKKSESNSLSNLVETLKNDYPNFRFISGRKFMFRPPKTIVLGPPEPNDRLLLMHELSHAILGHTNYDKDIKRLKMEAEAWSKTRELASVYDVDVDEEIIQDELDTYRDWLHKKSRCPRCGLTRFQDLDGYHCPRCENLN